MELLIRSSSITVSTHSFPHSSFSSSSSKLSFHGHFSHHKKFRRKSHRKFIPLRVSSTSDWFSTSNRHLDEESQSNGEDLWRDSTTVEVIGIGSRKDAVLDFCLESSFGSCPMRFWTIHMGDSPKVQLVQRTLGEDMVLRSVEGPLVMQSCPQAIVLVATAGYGLDHTMALELLRSIKSAEGLATAIVLKPFTFEGQRRQHEVEELVKKLWEFTNFCIVVETDSLLRKEAVTLAEALRTANNAVLLAINAVSVLMSDMHPKFLDGPQDAFKEVKAAEILSLIKRSREAKVGFGAGYNFKSSIARALFDCPFLSGGVKDLNGTIICTVATADLIEERDMQSFIRIFRQSTECNREIIFSRLSEPDLEPNLIVTTILVVGDRPESKDHQPIQPLGDVSPSEEVFSSSTYGNAMSSISADSADQNLDVDSEELGTLFTNNGDEIHALGNPDGEERRTGFGFSLVSPESASSAFHQETTFVREPLSSWNLGPGFHIAQQWAKERATSFQATTKTDELNSYTLPVGVKSSEKSMDGQFLNSPQFTEGKALDDTSGEFMEGPNIPSWDALTDAGLEAVSDIYNAASSLLKRRHVDVPRKQGLLSVRAASMLEAERDSEKKWTLIIEMQYRGGIYKGHCQGGLPEGKGQLNLMDGSFYDGMWRYGKRSGWGTFYCSNGDVFQGSWRDDLMHGKGWFYFHTGDRWFANFWKGKANGEGRYYTKFGSIFFGHFQDGWRHGESLCIDADGTRWMEVWDEGVLVSRNKLDSESHT